MMSLLTVGGLDQMIFKGPSQAKTYYHSTDSIRHEGSANLVYISLILMQQLGTLRNQGFKSSYIICFYTNCRAQSLKCSKIFSLLKIRTYGGKKQKQPVKFFLLLPDLKNKPRWGEVYWSFSSRSKQLIVMPKRSPVETKQENESIHHKALSCSDMRCNRTSGEGQRTTVLHPLVLYQVVIV